MVVDGQEACVLSLTQEGQAGWTKKETMRGRGKEVGDIFF